MRWLPHRGFLAIAVSVTSLGLVTANTFAQETEDCRCACVSGKVEAVCTSAIAVRPVCVPRVCDIVPPSVKPIEVPAVPPIGTNKCEMKQVLNEYTHEYEWQRLCYQTHDTDNQVTNVPNQRTNAINSGTNNQNANSDQSGALGQAVGSAIGTGIARSIENHRINSFCKANPTSTYVTNTGLKIDCPSATLSTYEQSEIDEYCANNPGSWMAFGKHRVDCLTPPNPPNLKWAKWELKEWEWDYKNPRKINLPLSGDQMRSNWDYWRHEYCSLAELGARYKDLDGKKQQCH
jgi:hypothetical protein